MKCFVLNVCECLLLLVCYFGIAEAAEDECKLPEDKLGKCVELSACHPYVALLQESTTTELGLKMTQERRCGLDGVNIKVCCPTEDGVAKTRTPQESDVDDYVDDLPAPANCGRMQSVVGAPVAVWNGLSVKTHQMAQWMALLAYKALSLCTPTTPSIAPKLLPRFAPKWDCGGSIITKKHVLTAAHCIRDSLYVVRVGELDLAKTNKDFNPIDFRIKKTIPHENYTKFHNDIGILIVDGTIPIDDPSLFTFIAPVCLPEAGFPYEREGPLGTFITGWGENEDQGRRPTNLLYAYLDILEQQECQKTYSDEALTIDERVFCAGDRNKGRDACNGDSGGPFIGRYYLPDCRRIFFYQVGLISYGYRCSAGWFTGVYTNVTYFMPWILEKVTEKKNPRQWTRTTQAPIIWFN